MPKNTERGIYDQWYQNNRPKILHGEWNLVSRETLGKPELQTKRGLNIITYLPTEINEAINSHIMSEISPVIGESGWVLPEVGRHITVLDILPHNTDPDVLQTALRNPKYTSTITQALSPFTTPVDISFQGIFASPDGITLQGFPVGDGLRQLRSQLRKRLEEEGLINMEKKKYLLETAHVALVKFVQPLDGARLLEQVDRLRDVPIGTFRVKDVLLNISPQYDKSKTIEVIEKISI